METINLKPFIGAHLYGESFETFAGWLITNMVSCLPDDQQGNVIANSFRGRQQDFAEVKLEINGAELPFIKSLQRLHQDYNEAVMRDAHQIVQDKLSERMSSVCEVLDDVERKLRQMMREIIPPDSPPCE
jgi:uncharacterized protein YukE